MPTPVALAQSCEAAIARLQSATQTILTLHSPRTFWTVTLPLETAMSDARDALAIDRFARSVAADANVRDASEHCDAETSDEIASLEAQPALYDAVRAAARSNTARTDVQRELNRAWLETLRRAGADVHPAYRAEFVALESELRDLQASYARNLARDDSRIVLGRRQLGGIPHELLASFTRERGDYVVPVNDATASFLTYATDPGARRAYWMAYENRAWRANVPIFERTLAVRDRLSHLLGYESWADYRLAGTMAASPARVDKFLSGAIDALRVPADAERERMRAAIATQERSGDATLQPWDVAHAQYLLRRKVADATQPTVDSALNVARAIVGIDFKLIDTPDAWAPGVIGYEVRDLLGTAPIGYAYFDLDPRPGRAAGFETFTLETARVVAGVRRPPVTAIVGSGSDVGAFFRAFGRELAALLAASPYETLNQDVPRDFRAVPARVFETFAQVPPPDAYQTTQMLALATLDLRYHTSGDRIDSTALWAQEAEAVASLPFAPGTHPTASFRALMDGSDAALYVSPWSQAYAQDLATAFSSASEATVGMRFREAILAPAGSEDPQAEIRSFLGRPPSATPFYREFTP
ncbi:MAG TPA: M3 family metallopeptidase [Candidatus Baltobacteraceae bacterium]|nr:M3 family metallopeptidase [Candidatus Baltobacteraceae bacterium]